MCDAEISIPADLRCFPQTLLQHRNQWNKVDSSPKSQLGKNVTRKIKLERKKGRKKEKGSVDLHHHNPPTWRQESRGNPIAPRRVEIE